MVDFFGASAYWPAALADKEGELLARSVPKAFYNGPAWQACRSGYLQLHPFCEDCLMRGIYTPAEHVHHMIWLTADNYTDARISLNFDNLRAVCVECHNRRHATPRQQRYTVDERGIVSPLVDF